MRLFSLRHSAPLCALPLAVLTAFAPVRAETPLPVAQITAHAAPAQLHFEFSGSVEAAESVPVGFRNGGRIVAMRADVGDAVAQDQVLAELDPAQARAAEQAARAQASAAEALLDQAEQARMRAAELAQRGAGTQAALDAATESALAARSSLDQARAQLAKATQAVDDCTLRAPVAGIVTARSGEPGQIVAAAAPVLTLARDGAREAVFHVPDVADLDAFMGRKVTLRLIGTEAPPFRATVTEIAPLTLTATGTVRVKARIDGASPGLGAAVVSSIDLPLGPAILLPWQALMSAEGGPAVWTIDAQTHAVALTPVVVSRYTDTGFEVVSGLSEGAQVVTAGAHLLYPGRVVAAVEGAP